MQADSEVPTKIEREFRMARAAAAVGNEGKVRVCARRAAGIAITWFLSRFPRDSWKSDAVSQLQHLQEDPVFPQEARDAATRLTARITSEFAYPSGYDPIGDANIVIGAITTMMAAHDS